MTRFYISVIFIIVMVLFGGYTIDTEEQKINELEQTVEAMDKAQVASDSMIENLLVTNDELSGANETLIGLTPCHGK